MASRPRPARLPVAFPAVPRSPSALHRACAAALACALAATGLGLVGSSAAGAADPTPAAPTTPVLSARRMPGLLQGAVADPALAQSLRGTLDKANPSTWCTVIEDRGRPVLTVNPDQPVAPASLQKVLTSTALLEHFGPDHTLRTVMAAGAAPTDGVVQGNLYLVGGGDPLLTTTGYQQSFDDPNQPWSDAGALVDALAAAGVREVRGDVVGDDSRYDAERWGPTWPARYKAGDPSIGPLSALTINDGYTGFTATPDKPNPKRTAGDPPALAADTLAAMLRARGIQVTGRGVAGKAPDGAVEVAAVDSKPMRELVGEMVLDSDNTTAELLTKELGLSVSGQGTTAAGVAAVRDIVAGLGIPVAGLDLKDGSGLDPANQVTCRAVMTALERFGPTSEWAAHLAVAGQAGTLRKRMAKPPAAGNVRAKTGTLNAVNALAGWATTPPGATLAFTAIGNGTDSRGTGAADAFAAALMSYPQGPPLTALGPR